MSRSRANQGRPRLRRALAAPSAVLLVLSLLTATALGAGYIARHVGKRSHAGHHRRPGRAASSAPAVTISPLPGTPDASPHTQISFLGLPASEITDVSVVGSRSGRHSGHLESYASAPGASFLPDKGFIQGEQVHVSALVGPAGSRRSVGSAFTIGRHFNYRFPSRKPHDVILSDPGVRSFPSEPDLHPPTVSVTVNSPQASPGEVFFGFNGGNAQWGPTIIDGNGHLVWFHQVPGADHAMDFKVTEYEGKPALVWWQGTIPPIGVGFGEDVIYNDHYQPVAHIKAGNGYHADLHEVLITPQGQAYTTAETLVKANTSSVGGFNDGGIVDPLIQEIDIKTGLVMFEWHAFGHVSLRDSYSKPAKSPGWPFDFFHANSISLDPSGDGNILISSRNTWAGYEIDHRTGQILWRIGGKHSTFQMGPHTRTAYQHDMKWQPDHTITIFDNGASPTIHHQSRVLHERINWNAKRVELISDDFHKPGLLADSQGDDQLLPDGNSFVGWGAQPYFTEFGPEGNIVFDAHLPTPGESYRAYRFQWEASPSAKPSIAVSKSGSGVEVYASWNGATNVASWRVLAGQRSHLEPVSTVASSGFETKIAVGAAGPWFAVQPLDSAGNTLAISHAVQPK